MSYLDEQAWTNCAPDEPSALRAKPLRPARLCGRAHFALSKRKFDLQVFSRISKTMEKLQ